MRALSLTRPGQLEIVEIPEPVLSPGEILIRIRRAGICGTDIHAFRGEQPFFSYPRIPGHELAGIVEDPGSSVFIKGQWVSVIPYRNCGTCIACRNDLTNCCTAMKVIGVHIDGGMTDYLCIPQNLAFSAPGLSPSALAVLEPLAIGTHAVARASLKTGETAVVLGLGPIGIGVAASALRTGAKVIGIETSAPRRNWVRKHLPSVILPEGTTETIQSAISDITSGEFASVVFEATGNLKALESTLPLLAHGGRIILVGLQSKSFQFSHPEFHKRETTLMSSRNATIEDFSRAADLITSAGFPVGAYAAGEIMIDRMPERMTEICNSASESEIVKYHVRID